MRKSNPPVMIMVGARIVDNFGVSGSKLKVDFDQVLQGVDVIDQPSPISGEADDVGFCLEPRIGKIHRETASPEAAVVPPRINAVRMAVPSPGISCGGTSVKTTHLVYSKPAMVSGYSMA